MEYVPNVFAGEHVIHYIQPVRLLVLARAYQPWYNIFLSQQTSINRAYQARNQPTNRLHVECSLVRG